MQEKEFNEIMRNKKQFKTDPEAFRRLTAPKIFAKCEEIKIERKKTFSIREAIESGKRLMNSGRRVVRELEMTTPNLSPMRKSRTEDWGIGRKFSPKKVVKLEGKRNLDEVFMRCKNKAMILNFIGKKFGDENAEKELMLRTLDSYRSYNSEKGVIK